MLYRRSSADITDGLSHTAAFSEKLRGDGIASLITPETDIFFLPSPWLGLTNQQYFNECRMLKKPYPSHDSRHGMTWMLSGSVFTWYNHITVPNSVIPDCASRDAEPYPGLFPARSWHLNGVNLLMTDGAVRFISEEIEPQTWVALGTRANGETVSNF
jgi:hypothetical protein